MTLSKSSLWTSAYHEALDAAQVVENGKVVKYPHFGGKKYKAEYHIFPYILYKSTCTILQSEPERQRCNG